MTINFIGIRFDYADHDLNSACAIGLVKVTDGKQTDHRYIKFAPQNEIVFFMDDISQTGGLREEDIVGLNGFGAIWPEIDAFMGNLPLVANSATTYMKTLEILWSEFGIHANPRQYLCTQVLGRKITKLGSFNLEYYANYFGYELAPIPTALDKAKATTEIALGLFMQMNAKNIEELAEKADIQLGSISSTERVSCKTIRRIESTLNKSTLQNLRSEFATTGFDSNHPLFEKFVLVTGTLKMGTRQKVDEALASVGAFPELNFTKKTNYLVVGYDKVDGLTGGGQPTGKISKALAARENGQEVEILDEQTFFDLLEN